MIKKNLIANLIGKSWGTILSILLIPIYIKLLGVESYGLIGFYLTLSSVFGILDLGIGSALNREVATKSVDFDNNEIKNIVRTFEVIYWSISILIFVIIFTLSPFISRFWIQTNAISHSDLLVVIKLMGVSLLLQFPISLYQGGIMGLQKQVPLNIILVLTGTFRGIGQVLVLKYISPNIIVFFEWQILTNLITVLLLFWFLWKNIPNRLNPKFDSKVLKQIRSFLIILSLNSFIGILVNQFDKILLSKYLTMELFSYYSIATVISSIVWLITIPINNTFFPKFAKLYKEKDELELAKNFHKSSQLLILFLVPISFIFIFFSDIFLQMWLQDSKIVEHSYLIASILLFGTMLNGIASIISNCSVAFGYPNIVTRTNLVQLVLIVPLFTILVHFYQGIGAAVGWVILNCLYFIFMIPKYFKKHLKNEKNDWYFKDVLIPVIISVSISFLSRIIMPEKNPVFFSILWMALTYVLLFVICLMFMSEIKTFVIKVRDSYLGK